MGKGASEPPSRFSRRGQSSWQAAAVLLAASILNSCFLLTQSQSVTKIRVRWEPEHPSEGESLTLTPGGSPRFLFCKWYRGGQVGEGERIFTYLPTRTQQNGPAHTGRETGGFNCSLHIRRLTSEDTGNYTVLKALSTASSEIGGAYVKVLGSRELDKATITWIVIGTVGTVCLVAIICLLHYSLCSCCWCCCRCCVPAPRARYPPYPPRPQPPRPYAPQPYPPYPPYPPYSGPRWYTM